MTKRNDLTGKIFGFLEVLMLDETRKKTWVCKCKCGKIRCVAASDLTRKNRRGTRGCYSCSAMGKRITHGLTGTPEYRTWASVVSRCLDSSNSAYRYYGARGIKVDPKFLGKNGFVCFLAEVGNRPKGKTIDRIDNNKGYEPGNLRWATPAEQSRNLSRNKWIELEGQRLCLKDASVKIGIGLGRIRYYANTRKVTLQEAINHFIKMRE